MSSLTHTGVIGYPVTHSLSPIMHNAAYRACGLHWEYGAIEIAPDDADRKIDELFIQGYRGVNVTMPYKERAYEMSIPHGAAARVQSVNTLVYENDELHGYSTDGNGFLDAVTSHDVALDDARYLIVGAGGASRSICDALIRSHAHVWITSRRIEQSLELIDAVLAHNDRERRGDIDVVEYSDRDTYAGQADVIVNATPVGMTREGKASTEMPLTLNELTDHQVVIDTIYYPLETELIRHAQKIGCRAFNGLDMLLYQAARSFTLMTGEHAPIDVMRAALEQAVSARDGDTHETGQGGH